MFLISLQDESYFMIYSSQVSIYHLSSHFLSTSLLSLLMQLYSTRSPHISTLFQLFPFSLLIHSHPASPSLPSNSCLPISTLTLQHYLLPDPVQYTASVLHQYLFTLHAQVYCTLFDTYIPLTLTSSSHHTPLSFNHYSPLFHTLYPSPSPPPLPPIHISLTITHFPPLLPSAPPPPLFQFIPNAISVDTIKM